MDSIFHCEFEYIPSHHLSQIYEGFYRLVQKKWVTVSITNISTTPKKPILKVRLITKSNQTFIVYYDVLDGFNWLDTKPIKENLLHFQKTYEADFYFKRSFNKDIVQYTPKNCNVFPLGLNCNIDSTHNFGSLKTKLNNSLKKTIAKKYMNRVCYMEDFEYPPICNKQSRVLFFARLWDPKDINGDTLKQEREERNHYRTQCIEACQREFGAYFTGGLQRDEFSEKYAPFLIAPKSITNRKNFINNIRSHNICIATTGLHGSIGWKFAEYIASSRAILSEPLNYTVPGTLAAGNNYCEFRNIDELLSTIDNLLTNKKIVKKMMYNNFYYYNQFLKPENLILNSLLTVCSYKGKNEIPVTNDKLQRI